MSVRPLPSYGYPQDFVERVLPSTTPGGSGSSSTASRRRSFSISPSVFGLALHGLSVHRPSLGSYSRGLNRGECCSLGRWRPRSLLALRGTSLFGLLGSCSGSPAFPGMRLLSDCRPTLARIACGIRGCCCLSDARSTSLSCFLLSRCFHSHRLSEWIWSIRSDPSPVTSRPGVEGFRGPTALLPWWGSLCGSLSTNHDTPFPAKHKYLLALAGVVGGGRSKGRRAQDATMPAHDRRWWPWAGIGADYTRALRGGAHRVVQRPEEISKEIASPG